MNEMALWGILTGLVALGFWIARHSFFRVEEGNLAVLITFGAAEHDPGDSAKLLTHAPGLHRKLPWQKVLTVPMMEQIVDLSGEKGRRAMAADGTILRFDSILRFQPTEERLADYLFGMSSPRDHVTGLFTCLLRNEIANFGATDVSDMGSTDRTTDLSLITTGTSITIQGPDMGSFAYLRRERAKLNQDIAAFCHAEIGGRYGIRFNAVDLVDILPPDDLAAALNAVIHAHSEAGAQYYRTDGDCQQKVLAAEQGVAVAEANALAVEREMTMLASYLGELEEQGTLDLYVRRRRAEVLGDARTLYFRDGNV